MAKDTTKIYMITGTRQRAAVRGAYVPENLTADSVPDMDNWGPDDYWSCEAYVQWYQLNKQKYGAQVARNKFLAAYEQWGFGSYNHDCHWDTNYRNFFASEGIDVDSPLSSLLMPVYDSAGNLVDVVQNVTEGASNVSEGVKRVGSVLGWLLPVAAIGGGIYLANKYEVWPFDKPKKRK
jgi:hypothetical protein